MGIRQDKVSDLLRRIDDSEWAFHAHLLELSSDEILRVGAEVLQSARRARMLHGVARERAVIRRTWPVRECLSPSLRSARGRVSG